MFYTSYCLEGRVVLSKGGDRIKLIVWRFDGFISGLTHPIQSHWGTRPCKARTGWNLFSSLLYGTRLPLAQRGATQIIDCSADLLLTFVWDMTASGTVRSNPKNVLHTWSVPTFILGRDYLWNSKELHRGKTAQLICSSLHYGTRLPLEHGGAPFCWYNSSCPRGAIVKQVEQSIKFSAILIEYYWVLLNPVFNLSFEGSLGPKGPYHQHCTPYCFRGSLGP